jgi:hypothetical protein
VCVCVCMYERGREIEREFVREKREIVTCVREIRDREHSVVWCGVWVRVRERESVREIFHKLENEHAAVQ